MKGCNGDPSWWHSLPKEYKIGRCYHTTWQSNSGMRFILKRINDDKVTLGTKHNNKEFQSNLSDLRDTNSNKFKNNGKTS